MPTAIFPLFAPVANLSDAVTMHSGFEHNCVVQSTGLVQCWGRNQERQLASANDSPSSIPVPTADNFDVYP